ncbi:MAG: hypothetical protein ACK5YT_14685 [Bacteroidota bacterium]|jgi:hypothetical protein|nr:hypothetical protein [Cytophagales bacterium]
MKRIVYALIFTLVVVSCLVFANRAMQNEVSEESAAAPLSAAEVQAVVKKWEATPEGINFKKWEASLAGQRVLASAAKINGLLKDSSDVAAFVTSLSPPSGSRLGFAVTVRMKGDDYILSFGPLQSNEFQQLRTLKVNDEIIVRSHFVSYAPRYSYPIVTGNYVARGSEIIYKAPPRKGGC